MWIEIATACQPLCFNYNVKEPGDCATQKGNRNLRIDIHYNRCYPSKQVAHTEKQWQYYVNYTIHVNFKPHMVLKILVYVKRENPVVPSHQD